MLHVDASDWRKAGKRAPTQGQEMSDLITFYTPHHILHPPVLFIKSTEEPCIKYECVYEAQQQTNMVITSQANLILWL